MKIFPKIFIFTFLIVMLAFLSQCAKESKASISFESEIISYTDSTITVSGRVISNDQVRYEGIVYGSDSTVSISRVQTYNSYSNGNNNYAGFSVNSAIGEPFTLTIPNSQFHCKYYLKAFAISEGTPYYGPLMVYQNPTTNCYLGKGPAGGDIFYLDSTGGGLEAAPTGYNHYYWGCSGLSVAGTSTALGSGQANTNAILAACASNSAAKECDEFVLGEFGDWYLPSLNELQLMYTNLYEYGVGNYYPNLYISSTQFDASNCYGINFSNGNTVTVDKYDDHPYYRPIRKF